jgi:hypothetical protein
MPGKASILVIAAIAAPMALVPRTVAAQDSGPSRTHSSRTATSSIDDNLDTAKTLRRAAEALGMLRYSDIGSGNVHLPAVDVVTTMEIWGNGTSYVAGQPYETEYHASIDYNPPAMRVEITRVNSDVDRQGAAVSQHSIQVVTDTYSWSESEVGGGLVPGRGTATPDLAAAKTRLLQLWTFPYGVIKAALAAGDKAKITTDHGVFVITFALSGQLAGVMVRATLNDKDEVAKVETRTEDPALTEMITETTYSDYADRGEILTDVKTPGHIIQEQNGHPVLDIRVTKADADNPYLVFPVPESIHRAAARLHNK